MQRKEVRNAWILDQRVRGVPIARIADQLGISTQAVSQTIKNEQRLAEKAKSELHAAYERHVAHEHMLTEWMVWRRQIWDLMMICTWWRNGGGDAFDAFDQERR